MCLSVLFLLPASQPRRHWNASADLEKPSPCWPGPTQRRNLSRDKNWRHFGTGQPNEQDARRGAGVQPLLWNAPSGSSRQLSPLSAIHSAPWRPNFVKIKRYQTQNAPCLPLFFPFQNHWNTVTNHQLQKRFHRPKFLRLCRLLVDYYSVETVQVAYLHIPPSDEKSTDCWMAESGPKCSPRQLKCNEGEKKSEERALLTQAAHLAIFNGIFP